VGDDDRVLFIVGELQIWNGNSDSRRGRFFSGSEDENKHPQNEHADEEKEKPFQASFLANAFLFCFCHGFTVANEQTVVQSPSVIVGWIYSSTE
jgi:hypothetical protein